MRHLVSTSVTLEELAEALNVAIIGNLCVQVVPSDYEMLYLGFGSQMIKPPTITGTPGQKARYIRHGNPLYEIRSSYSHWWIEKSGKLLGGSVDQTRDEAVAASLLGIKALSWKFLFPRWGVQIDFEEDLTWILEPLSDFPGEEVCRLRFSQETLWVLMNDGRTYKEFQRTNKK